MKTYFSGIRKWSAAIAIVTPALALLAFLLLLAGARYWAVLPWLLSLVAAVNFPPGLSLTRRPGAGISGGRGRPRIPPCPQWLRLAGMALIYFWLTTVPEVRVFFDRVLSGAALRHWAAIAGACLLTGAAALQRWRAVKALTDQDIYDFFKTAKDEGPA